MEESEEKAATSTRTMEIVTALFIFACGALVIYDSQRLGSKWADDGPQAGYFPFYVGLIICIASAINFIKGLLDKDAAGEAFVTRAQLRLVLAVLVPTVIYAVLIKPLGIYVASIVFIAWFMKVLGKYGWLKIVLVGIGVNLTFFLLFEIWFKVPLPKGPLEAALGFA